MPAPAIPYLNFPFDDVHPVADCALADVPAERAGAVAPTATAIVAAVSTAAASTALLRLDIETLLAEKR